MTCAGVLHFAAVKVPNEGKALFLISLQLLVEAGDDHAHCPLQRVAEAFKDLASWL